MDFIADTTDRLDKFLASKMDISRGKIQKMIKAGQVTVNSKQETEPDYILSIGDKIELPKFSDELKPSEIKLNIVFENNDLAVIDKPAGLVVHPGAGNTEDTLSQALLSYWPQIKNVGDPHRPGIVHRLDEDTSGLIVVAKTQKAYEFLKQTFQDRTIEKEYLALVHGTMEKHHDFIDLPIAKVPTHRKMSVRDGSASGGKNSNRNWKEAKTEYFVVAETPSPGLRPENKDIDNFTLLRVKLHTGRTHQIRIHMNAIGHPLVGDSLYGGKYKQQDLSLIQRQFLHAYKLKFQLIDKTWIELVSLLPEDLKEVLSKLNIKLQKI